MFNVGQKVVAVNVDFEPWVFDLYRQLPRKDQVYTVRAVRPARSDPKFEVDDDAEIKMKDARFDILLLLEELVNGNDPHSTVPQELGFKIERFREMLEDEQSAYSSEQFTPAIGRELVPQ